MSTLRRISAFSFLFAFILVNTGLGIYTHSCSMAGVERSYLVRGEDPCEDLHEKQPSSCCDEQEDHADKKDCCSTDAQYLQLDVDTAPNDYAVQAFIVPVFDESFLVDFYTSEYNVRTLNGQYYVHPPPKYQGRDLQCIHQVYTI